MIRLSKTKQAAVGETGSSKKKEDMHMHKKQIALLMAGLMTVSSLTMGSVTVMAVSYTHLTLPTKRIV